MNDLAKTPLDIVRGKFQNKEKLVDKLMDLIPKAQGGSKDDLKGKLLKVSNKKLLKIHQRLSKSSS